MSEMEHDIWVHNHPEEAREQSLISSAMLLAAIAITFFVLANKAWSRGDRKKSTIYYGISAVCLLIVGGLVILSTTGSPIMANICNAGAFMLIGYDIAKYKTYLQAERRRLSNKYKKIPKTN